MLQVPPLAALQESPLRTERCTLAPLVAEDAADLHRAVSTDGEAMARWLSIAPLLHALGECERYAAEGEVWWKAGAGLRFSIRSAEGGAFWGLVSLDSLVHTALSAQVGVFLVDAARGRGLGAEAVGAVLRFAFDVLGARRIGAATSVDNAVSIAFFSRLGFQREGTAREAEFLGGRWVDHAVFSRLASDEGRIP